MRDDELLIVSKVVNCKSRDLERSKSRRQSLLTATGREHLWLFFSFQKDKIKLIISVPLPHPISCQCLEWEYLDLWCALYAASLSLLCLPFVSVSCSFRDACFLFIHPLDSALETSTLCVRAYGVHRPDLARRYASASSGKTKEA